MQPNEIALNFPKPGPQSRGDDAIELVLTTNELGKISIPLNRENISKLQAELLHARMWIDNQDRNP